jgi:hypothetical protein
VEIPVFKHPNKNEQELIEIQRGAHETQVKTFRLDHDCDRLEGIFDKAGSGFLDREYRIHNQYIKPTPGTTMRWLFTSGVLTEMLVDFETATYDQVKSDVSSKVAAQPTESLVPFQNGYGASWNDQVTDWVTPNLHLRLEHKNNPTSPSLNLDVESRSAYDARVMQQKNRPSTLD